MYCPAKRLTGAKTYEVMTFNSEVVNLAQLSILLIIIYQEYKSGKMKYNHANWNMRLVNHLILLLPETLMHPMLNIGIKAAHAAGDIIVRSLEQVADIPVNEKGLSNYVSNIDKISEEKIIKTILKFYPEHSILAEESGQQGNGDYQWIIDPLDGTTNYLHGFPHFAVSIALKHEDTVEQAIIYDPLRQELFTATRGNGAHLNNRRIRVSKRKNLNGALLGTGFPFRYSDNIESFIQTFRATFPLTSGIRRAGAVSLDLAYIACGRLDGFWEFSLNKWNIAAGALLVIEAGGIITDMNGTNNFLNEGNVLTGNVRIHREMLEITKNLYAHRD